MFPMDLSLLDLFRCPNKYGKKQSSINTYNENLASTPRTLNKYPPIASSRRLFEFGVSNDN